MSTVYFKIEVEVIGAHGKVIKYRYFKDDIDELHNYDGIIILVSEDEYLLNTIK